MNLQAMATVLEKSASKYALVQRHLPKSSLLLVTLITFIEATFRFKLEASNCHSKNLPNVYEVS